MQRRSWVPPEKCAFVSLLPGSCCPALYCLNQPFGLAQDRDFQDFRIFRIAAPILSILKECVTMPFCPQSASQGAIARIEGRPHPNPLPPGEGICHTPS